MTLLSYILITPVAGAVITGLAGRVNGLSARMSAMFFMLVGLVLSTMLMITVEGGTLVEKHAWFPALGATFHLEADGLGALMVLLTAIIGVIAVLISWHDINEKVGAFHVWVLLLQTGILLVFMARDMLLFYFGWELMLIPMFFIIGVWGHEDKLYSAIKFFLFTFTGSIFLLLALLYVYFAHAAQTGQYSFDFADLLATKLTGKEQRLIFLGMFIGFAVKVPLFPFHTWLPDAHTQAPTAGSLILAGVLLKTGVYGIMRFVFPLVPVGVAAYTKLGIALSVIGIFYGALAAFSQRDFKRLVAYSSISHLGFVTLGLFVGNASGYQGAVLQMVNHGLATGGLFLIAGILQERTHTRSFEMFGGLWKQMPTMGAFLLFFAMASLGIPGTGNFVGEFYVIAGAFLKKWWLGAVTSMGVLFAAMYSLRVFLATMHGPESVTFKKLPDTNLRENVALFSLVILLVVIGFRPSLVTAPLYWGGDKLVPQKGRSADPIGQPKKEEAFQTPAKDPNLQQKPAQTVYLPGASLRGGEAAL
ncbi:MAG: NADH-quinone oxidoreductase subunit M [Candidatus Sumerlaeaceae bacterium]|nr:NADH-quinone oxidoreductase subunit M [Candidatus Sumerlaeaceae bacterium]